MDAGPHPNLLVRTDLGRPFKDADELAVVLRRQKIAISCDQAHRALSASIPGDPLTA